MANNTFTTSYPYILRSTLQQTEEGLLYVAPKIRVGLVDQPMSGLVMRRFEIHHRGAATDEVGIGFRWSNKHWKAGQWTEVGSVYTDDTADAQDLDVDDFALETTTVNDGFVILSDRPFSWVSIRVTTTGAATANTHVARYSNFAGTGWTAAPATADLYFDTFQNAIDYVAGEIAFVWDPPADWGKVVSLGTIPNGYYALNVRATVVAGAAALAGAIEVGSMKALENLATDGIWEQERMEWYDPYADAVVAFFTVADNENRVSAEVTTG